MVPSDMRRARSGHKLKYKRFPVYARKQFFTVSTEHWYRLSREFVESPDLETFKSQLDMVLGNLPWVAVLAGPYELQRGPSNFKHSVSLKINKS